MKRNFFERPWYLEKKRSHMLTGVSTPTWTTRAEKPRQTKRIRPDTCFRYHVLECWEVTGLKSRQNQTNGTRADKDAQNSLKSSIDQDLRNSGATSKGSNQQGPRPEARFTAGASRVGFVVQVNGSHVTWVTRDAHACSISER